MSEDGLRITPLAGRVAINKKEAVTGSVLLAILINIFVLVLVQFLSARLFQGYAALFWVLAVLLIVADAALCVLVFRRALSDVCSAAAPPYTIAYRSDGYFVLCHKSGAREYVPLAAVADVKATPAKFGFIVNGWAYSGNLNYGKVTFYVFSGGRIEKKCVKRVVNCAQAANFIRQAFLPHGTCAELYTCSPAGGSAKPAPEKAVPIAAAKKPAPKEEDKVAAAKRILLNR